jgi:hypothetical protein
VPKCVLELHRSHGLVGCCQGEGGREPGATTRLAAGLHPRLTSEVAAEGLFDGSLYGPETAGRQVSKTFADGLGELAGKTSGLTTNSVASAPSCSGLSRAQYPIAVAGCSLDAGSVIAKTTLLEGGRYPPRSPRILKASYSICPLPLADHTPLGSDNFLACFGFSASSRMRWAFA